MDDVMVTSTRMAESLGLDRWVLLAWRKNLRQMPSKVSEAAREWVNHEVMDGQYWIINEVYVKEWAKKYLTTIESSFVNGVRIGLVLDKEMCRSANQTFRCRFIGRDPASGFWCRMFHRATDCWEKKNVPQRLPKCLELEGK